MADRSMNEDAGSILDRLFDVELRINLETAIILLIILVAVFTRFYDLESRVMSHDESLHTYYSWRLKEFQDYRHTPLMHGPLQFHLIAFSYFVFGDSDASARVPFALIGVVSIALMLLFRRWLGRWGSIVAMVLMLISPYMLYYQRYVRNEAIVVLLGMLMFWVVFRYFQDREARWLFLLAVILSLHHATKETSFIYAAQLLFFLGVYTAWDLIRRMWSLDYRKWIFVFGLVFMMVGVVLVGWGLAISPEAAAPSATAPVTPLDPTALDILSGAGTFDASVTVGIFIAGFGLILMAFVSIWLFGRRLRREFPALDLIVITGTMTLPLLSAFPARFLGFEPFSGQSSVFNTPTGLIVLILFLLSIFVGLLWDWRRWSIAFAAFWGIFLVLYSNFFTYGGGISSGLVRSLGYWLVQHGVERGGQPLYYYLFIQIPLYEYLPAVGSIIAAGFGLTALRKKVFSRADTMSPRGGEDEESATDEQREEPGLFAARGRGKFPVILFLGYWVVTSLGVYSFAGERMPWLTVHIALPMIFLAGWGIDQLIRTSTVSPLRKSEGWIALILLLVFGYGLVRTTGALFSPDPPFRGNDLASLRSTSLFIGSATFTIGSFLGLIYLFQEMPTKAIGHLVRFALLASLFLLTARTALRASFLNEDLAIEYLVYAHSAPGVKTVLNQIEDFSERTTGGLAVDVAYDNDVSWPFTWYLRNYSNSHYYAENPTRELLNYPLILAGDDNWSEVESIIGNRYIRSEYIRMWWPNQDYFRWSKASIEAQVKGQTPLEQGTEASSLNLIEYLSHILNRSKPFFTDPQVRRSVWQIWLNRDFSLYGQINNRDLSLENWSPSDRMRFYIRRDVVDRLWDYGQLASGVIDMPIGDPYEDKLIEIGAIRIVEMNDDPLGFLSPRDLAVAADGSIYVADSGNHRILHLSSDGSLINQWGSYYQSAQGDPAPPGTFSEPWGIGVAPDGNIYVADTWNHRVQKFSAQGEFVDQIGPFDDQGEQIFWGPRAVAIDKSGRVYVVDTGNHRVAIYSRSGEFLGEFGGEGYDNGQFREPVGIAIDTQGKIYIADTWNHRVQVFEEISENQFIFSLEWPLEGWFGESLVNKPYLAISQQNHICLSDPEGYRVLCFAEEGTYSIGWGQFGTSASEFGLVNGIAFTDENELWVVDSGNHRIMLFQPPLP